jgi:hypothetical protein
MKVRALVTSMVILCVSASAARAGDLQAAASKAATAQVKEEAAPSPKRALFVSGTAIFAAGMAVGLFGFINDRNGEFAEFGEADSSNKKLGAAGLGVAFAGGVLMFLGTRHQKYAPAVAVGANSVTVSKQISW